MDELLGQSLVRDQVNRTPQQVFNVELHTEVSPGRCRAIKPHQNVHVAGVVDLVA